MKETKMCLNIFVHIPKCAGGTVKRHIEWEYRENERFHPHIKYKDIMMKVLNSAEQAEWAANATRIKRSWISKYLYSLPDSQRRSIRCIYGHATYYGIHEAFDQKPRYFTFLREPLARFISLYNYMLTVRVTPERLERYEILKKDGTLRSLDEWLEQTNIGQFSMTNFLSQVYDTEDLLQSFCAPSQKELETVKNMLRDFYFVGLTENDDDIEFTYGRLGITKCLPDKNVLRTKDTYIKPKSSEDARKIIMVKCPFDIELYEYARQLNHEKREQVLDYERTVSRTRVQRSATRRYMQIVWSLNRWYQGLPDKVRRFF
jgi:hypothetical protein